jgi:hypothetical protein
MLPRRSGERGQYGTSGRLNAQVRVNEAVCRVGDRPELAIVEIANFSRQRRSGLRSRWPRLLWARAPLTSAV